MERDTLVPKYEMTEEDIRLNYITPAIEGANWDRKKQILTEKYFTDGRVVFQGGFHSRKSGKKADYILYYTQNLPIAIVEAKDNKHAIGAGIQQAIDYAQILDIPFAYSSNGDGFIEHDFLTGKERELKLEEFPSPDDLHERFLKTKQLSPEEVAVVEEPYYTDRNTNIPRYYQRIAINRTVETIAKGDKRVLIVMATGTGKTFTAFQIIHILTESKKVKKVLYLADRNVLIDQTMAQDFRPFKRKMTKIKNKTIDTAFEIYMALYQQLVSYDESVEDPFKNLLLIFLI
jgi:type I restriction enzyme R subunit